MGLSNDQLRLHFSNASIGFETENPLLKDVNLTINSGEIVGLIGRSGIGKTTLLRTAAGLLSPLSGSVECCCDLTMNAKRGSIALIPQRLGLIQHQSVGYNVLMGALPGAKYLQTVLSLPSREIQEATKTGAVNGYYIARKAIFLGRWIKHCGWYPGYVIRLFKKEGARFSENLVHESVHIDGPTAYLKSPLIHYTDTSLDHYFVKFNKYTTLAARELFQSNYSCHLTDLIGRPIYSFIKMYIIKRGFLDGVQGLILCVLSACYVFTKYAKSWHCREQNKTKE